MPHTARVAQSCRPSVWVIIGCSIEEAREERLAIKLARRVNIKAASKNFQLRNPCNRVQLRWPPSNAHVLVLPKRYEKILCIQDWYREGDKKSDEGKDY